jgi:hypothetical protein
MKETIATQEKTPLILRILQTVAKIDWKALALVIAALGGATGAIWNKVDSMLDKALTLRMQQGVYETLAKKLGEIDIRLASLEKAHEPKSPGKRIKHVEAPKASDAPAAIMLMDISPAEKFEAARLPSFKMIQKKAESKENQIILNATPGN